MNKQIDEMAQELCRTDPCQAKRLGTPCYHRCKAYIYAERAINAGYRKQSDGEWIDVEDTLLYRYKCSLCGEIKLGKMTNFCPNCGARMKGDEE